MIYPGHGNAKGCKRTSWKDECKRHGVECYLVYRYKNEIRVRHGVKNGTFFPDNHPTWMTGIPDQYMTVSSSGKVLVKNENDILEAVEMLREHYRKKVENVKHTSNTTTKNIIECVEGKGYVWK